MPAKATNLVVSNIKFGPHEKCSSFLEHHMKKPKPQISTRVQQSSLDFIDDLAKRQGISHGRVIDSFVEALQGGDEHYFARYAASQSFAASAIAMEVLMRLIRIEQNMSGRVLHETIQPSDLLAFQEDLARTSIVLFGPNPSPPEAIQLAGEDASDPAVTSLMQAYGHRL